MIPISEWYAALGQFSFPTVFIQLHDLEIAALVQGESEAGVFTRSPVARIQQAIHDLPGSAFIGADVCVPTDSESYGGGPSVSYGLVAWRLLASSAKVRAAFESGQTRRITVRPFRRMNRMREFRLFFQDARLVAMSQYNLDQHFARLVKHEKDIWRQAQKFAEEVAGFLPRENLVMDVYYTSSDRIMIVDLNSWGAPTSPLLFKHWNRDWSAEPSLRLIPKPVKMKGEVSVSF